MPDTPVMSLLSADHDLYINFDNLTFHYHYPFALVYLLLQNRFYQTSKEIYFPTPTWGNHGPIFK